MMLNIPQQIAPKLFYQETAANTIYNNIIPFHLISDWELAYQISNLDLSKGCLPSIFIKIKKWKIQIRIKIDDFVILK